mmetsp:Transcript_6441/g.15770  ORF Transcript_6441/g.15770 Transcript_6441/m.15770 type:complete len:1079 (-) Transcript_6441:407-3643(-)
MEALLNFSQPLDSDLLDRCVRSVYEGTPAERDQAQRVLTQLQERINSEDASAALNWFRVDLILEQGTNPHTKFYALQILDACIKYRWRTLPREQCEGIKNFIVNLVIKLSSDEVTLRGQKLFISKLNLILVQVVKQEWPHNWPSFIADVVNASKANETLCENNMAILKLLSEEVFDFSRDEMTSAKAKRLKESFNADFSLIYQLCDFIMEHSQKPSLLLMTLQTLLRFLNWIPLGYIFETKMVEKLVYKYLPVPMFRNDSLACLTEIAGLDIGPAYNSHFEQLFVIVTTQLATSLPSDTNFAQVFESGSEEDARFIQNLALFYTTFLRPHLAIAEKTATTQPKLLDTALMTLVGISRVEDMEVFKICLEFWNHLASDLYSSECGLTPAANPTLLLAPQPGMGGITPGGAAPRRQLYAALLSKVRLVMISRMAKPEEVLIVEDENGEIIREPMKDSDAITLYKTMRETLVYLTHLNVDDTENIMLEKLAMQVDGSEWSWNNLNTLCWAIGSISGAMNEEDEKRFLVTVIKDLLGLCEMKRGKDNKAVIASNIMYVVGQYPRFLRAHWKFLKTVVNKLFEFMHELHPGVQDMACDTFVKIAQKCRRKFSMLQVGEQMPFVEELCLNLPSIISDLEPSQVHTFYEAVGYMVQSQADPQQREALLAKLMELPNQMWQDIMAQAGQDINVLKDQGLMKNIVNIIKTNERVVVALGHPFTPQLGRLYIDLLNVYKAYSEMINTAVQTGGQYATSTSAVRGMRAVKRETLKLLESYIERSEENEVILHKFVPPLLDPVLGDYVRSIPEARDPEVLSLFTCLINKLQSQMTPEVPRVFEAVFKSTLDMITNNFEDYPEHRMNLFNLLRAINQHCFPALLNSSENFRLIVESIKWAFKHTERNIAETGLNTLYELFNNVGKSQVGSEFYSTYYLSLLQDIFSVLTDTLHSPGFKLQSQILAHMFMLVESKAITVPLWDAATVQATDNSTYLRELLSTMFIQSFPNLTPPTVKRLVDGLFDTCRDQVAFKQHLRDFLVQLREFGGGEELYLDEREAEQARKAAEVQKRQEAVPGIINPHAKPDEMNDL